MPHSLRYVPDTHTRTQFVAMPDNLVYLAMYNLVNNREMPRSFADDVTHTLRPAP